MRIGQFTKYKQYIGSIEYDPEDEIYYGELLGIDDSVSYHADSIIDLEKHYHETVDDYIGFKKQISEDLVCISH